MNMAKAALKKIPPVIWMLAGIMLFFNFITPDYFSAQNITNILIQSMPLMILSFGQTLIVLTQGTDLSLGAQVSFTTVLWIYLMRAGVPIGIAAFVTLCCTATVGIVNGLIVSKGRIPPFIATLGMQNVLNSISLLLTFGASIYYYHDIFQIVTEKSLLFLPLPVWIAVLVFLATWILLYKTKFGANVFGLGGNPEALTLAGVNTVVATVKTYAYAGVIAGISGLVTACRVESGQPVVGVGWEFHAVAATLLGGTSLREGRGGIVGTIFGVFMIRILQNGLNVSGVSTLYQNAIIGFIVLMAIVIDALLRRAKEA
ncbi:MAG: ABC transporter permease [Treponema sp.]|jgi:ribose transport system permease protein|nr:ABC transporter permease [Treponema sp.]